MSCRHLLDEDRFCPTDILDRLSRHRLWQEPDEVTVVTGRQGHSDLAVLLHPANAGPMTGARVHHDDGRLGRIDLDAGGRNNSHQQIIDRTFQGAAVSHKFSLKIEHVRDFLGALLQVGVSPLPQHIEKQHRTLPGVQPIFLYGANIRQILHHSVSRGIVASLYAKLRMGQVTVSIFCLRSSRRYPAVPRG